MVNIDLRNAFNSLKRDDPLKGILKRSPNIYHFIHQCYHASTTLFYSDYRISSAVGQVLYGKNESAKNKTFECLSALS